MVSSCAAVLGNLTHPAHIATTSNTSVYLFTCRSDVWDDVKTSQMPRTTHYQLITMNKIDLTAIMALFNRIAPITTDALSSVIESMDVRNLAPGEFLLQQNDPAAIEVVILNGVMKSGVLDSQGHDRSKIDFIHRYQLIMRRARHLTSLHIIPYVRSASE